MLTALILICCSSLQDADRLVEKALTTVKEADSIRVSFTGHIEVPHSDDMDLHGTALKVGKDLLFIEYHASGGQMKFIVRKGDTVLEWHPLVEQWVDAQEMGDGAAGSGIQNPHEVFDSLLANKTSARFVEKTDEATKVQVNLDGPKLKPLLEELIDETQVRWSSTEGEAELEIDSKSETLKSVGTKAIIDRKEGGKITWTGKVVVEKTGGETEYRFFEKDSSGKQLKEIPLSPDARKKLGLAAKE